MPKVKLFKVFNAPYDYDKDILQEFSSGWQEITEEELKYLTSKEIYSMFNTPGSYIQVAVFEDKTEEIPYIINSIKDYIKDNQDKKEKEKLKRLAKKEESLKKLEAKKIAEAKKFLEEKGLL